jgi:hypothetical protein
MITQCLTASLASEMNSTLDTEVNWLSQITDFMETTLMLKAGLPLACLRQQQKVTLSPVSYNHSVDLHKSQE